ncbi:SirB2 family protein [Neptunomonas sp.]|uniref:SirB2 family protein n=1 Tax=Neptunomonas sp. TaxID=1971898 RepID=UPI0025F29715|nr:SirB2 family protein [Neptunomonas sp.]
MSELYPIIKHIHLTSVTLSILFFIVRGAGMLFDAQWLQKKLIKVLPHIIDTILLISAIALTFAINQYPFQADWLSAKVVGLILYIVLGTVALKRGKTKAIRISAFVLALLCITYILSVAITHNATPWG